MELTVLAGGLGTRLSGVLGKTPKALAPVDGTPFLSIQLDHWIQQGVTSFSFLLFHEADQIIDCVEKYKSRSTTSKLFSTRYIIEPKQLGTGGSIASFCNDNIVPKTLIVCNADTWLRNGIIAMKGLGHGQNTMCVSMAQDTGRYGRVHIDGNRVDKFDEKKPNGLPGYINVGLYQLDPSIFKNWDGTPMSLEADIFPGLVQSKDLFAQELECEFIDIGVPADYRKFTTYYAFHHARKTKDDIE